MPRPISPTRSPALEGFGDAVVDQGYTTAIVAGMGGSSLAPDVLHRTFGIAGGLSRPADPRFDRSGLRRRHLRRPRPAPDARPRRLEVGHDDRAERVPRRGLGPRARGPRRFAATTPTRARAGSSPRSRDPGRSIEAIPHHDDFREVFLNPPDIGGRYSALTYVGLVPASLIGLDLDALLASASAMLGACREPDPASQPGPVARASRSGRWRGPGATS